MIEPNKEMMFEKIRKKFGLYDLRKEVAKYVEKNFGTEFVEEALDKYDKINSGMPIGGFVETAAFLSMIERLTQQEEAIDGLTMRLSEAEELLRIARGEGGS